MELDLNQGAFAGAEPDMDAIVPVTRGLWMTMTAVLRMLDQRVTVLEARLNAAPPPPISDAS